MNEYTPALPCDSTKLVKFRKRIGKKGVEEIFAMSVALHGKDAQEKQVIIDTTVQEKNVTYPTDGKLAIKMIHHLHRIAKDESIQLRRTYIKEIKKHRIRKIIYTTNIIESVHRQFRKLTKTKGAFSNENSLLKLLYMGIQNAQKKWTMPIKNWNLTLSQLAIFLKKIRRGS